MAAYCYFNELTMCDSEERTRAFLLDFPLLLKGILAATNQQCNKVVVDDQTGSRIFKVLIDGFNQEYKNLYTTLLQKPFEQFADGSGGEDARDRFNLSEYTIALSPTRTPECKALGCAFENASISVGFPLNAFWRQFNFGSTPKLVENRL